MGMNLPTGFGGPSGGFNGTLSGIGSGLAGLLQGLVQGRLLRDQEQQQQQALQGDKMRNALSLYQLVAQIGQADPDALKSPALLSYLKQNTQGTIPLPQDAQGNIDTNAFRTPLSSFTQGPGYEKFLSLPKGSDARKQMVSGYGGTDEQKQQLIDLDQQLSPTEIDNAASNYRYYMQQIQNGADPRALVPTMNSLAQRSGDPQLTINEQGQVVPLGGGAALGASATTVAKVNNLNAGTDLKTTQKTWLDKLNPQRLANLQALTGLHREQLAVLPQELAIRAMNAQTAFGKLQVSQQNLDMAKQTFSKLGMTPQGVSAYDGVVKGLGETVNQERQALSAVQSNIAKMRQAGVPSNPTTPQDQATVALYNNMLAQESHLQNKLATDQQAFSKFNDGRSTYVKSLQQHVLHQQGAPQNWNPANTPPPRGKTITQAGLQQFAKDHNVPLDKARAQAQAAGYTIQP